MSALTEKKPRAKSIKCVVWDLDETLWDGTLLESDRVRVRPEVVRVIQELDSRGILQSIASKNDPATALAKLRELKLDEYFLYPQIHWNSKVTSLETIAKEINIGIDTLAFIDDQPFEREEVSFSLPEVLCIDAAHAHRVPAMPEMMPRFITDDARNRRRMYRADAQRNSAEKDFVGPKEEFLATLGMQFTIASCSGEDLKRAEELTVRTNQLNATGYTYSYEELDAFRQSPGHKLLIAGLTDRFGVYGKIGLALVECGKQEWIIKLLLMSCRVMSRGVGTILLHHIMGLAKSADARLLAEFVPTERNRMMYVTYKFAGFQEVSKQDRLVLLENPLLRIQSPPPYVQVHIGP